MNAATSAVSDLGEAETVHVEHLVDQHMLATSHSSLH